MKNKIILLIFFLFFNLLTINNILGDEIIFETPEIEIFENGNLLKAHKGGKAKTDKNTEIVADKFEYNKTTSILTANGNVLATDSLNKTSIKAEEIEYNNITSEIIATKNVELRDYLKDVVINANKIIYLINKKKISTEGKTKIVIENKYYVNSSDVIFLKNEMQIFSDKYTSLIDDKENFYTVERFNYLINDKLFRGKKINLNTKEKDKYFFDDGMVNLKTNEIYGKDLEVNFDNSVFANKNNEPRLKGNIAYSNKNKTEVSKGVFTTCKRREDDKCPPWIIESKEVKHDKIKKIIHYKNAWLKIYDVPVLYFPKFFHPDPTVKRQSGFLTPQIGDSEILGSSAYIPYFYVISNDKDLTFKPRVFGDNKFSIQSEYRQVTKNSKNIFDFSLTSGHKSNTSDSKDTRTHFFSNSKIDLNFDNFDYSNLEIQLQKTSNDTYLKLFKLESPLFGSNKISTDVSVLDTFLTLTTNKDDLSFDTTLKIYEKLGNANSDRYEFIFPSYNLSKILNTKDNVKGALSLNSSGSQHINNTNVYETQIINDLSYQSEDKFLNNGIINKFNVLFKNVNSTGKNSTQYKSSIQAELLSSLLFESSYPLLREGINFNNYFTPKLSLRYSPNNMKNLKDEDRRIDINNIWSLNRIASSSTIESGQSLTVGAEYKKSRNIDVKKVSDEEYPVDVFELSLATVFRDEKNENLPSTSTLGDKSSDIVGHIKLEPNNFFSANYNYSIDNNLNELKYNELSTTISVNNFVTSFKYLEENQPIGTSHYIDNTTSYDFNETSSITFSARRNKEIDLTEYYNLVYQYKNDCLTAAVQYKKDFYVDNDIKPTEQLFFSITIVPLGAYETKNIIPK